MAEAGAAIVIADGELTGAKLGGEVAALLADRAAPAGDGGCGSLAGPAAGRGGGRRRAARGGAVSGRRRRAPWAGRRIHLVGVGGAGMSAYARAAHALGAEVSGSDAAESEQTRALGEEGVLRAAIGHDAANLPAGEGVELYYSSAVPAGEPRARRRARAGPRRAPARGAARRALGAAAHDRRRRAPTARRRPRRCSSTPCAAPGLEPGWLVGAPVGGGLPNARWRQGEWLVVEADESDRSMLSLQRRDRGAHQRRARPPRDLLLARRAATRLPRAARRRASGRRVGPARAAGARRRRRGRLRARGARADAGRLALSLARGGGDAGGPRCPQRADAAGALEAARLAGAAAGAGDRRAGRVHGRRPALSAAGRERAAARRSTRTTRTTRPRSPRRCAARARSSTRRLRGGLPAPPLLAHGAARRASSAPRSRSPTWSSCSTSTRRASAPRTSPASAACRRRGGRRRGRGPARSTGCPASRRPRAVLGRDARGEGICAW